MYKNNIKILILSLIFSTNLSAQNLVNTFDPEKINHWNIKISTINWESATVKNALDVPYTTFITDFLKGKFNLQVNDSPKRIKAVGYQLSTPKCSKDQCSDFYINFITSASNSFISYNNQNETFSSNFQSGQVLLRLTINNNSEAFLSSSKQDLKNLFIGYHNDYLLLQNDPYLKNLGIRFGIGLDIYQYKLNYNGIQNSTNLIQIQSLVDTSLPPSAPSPIQFRSILTSDLNYLEFALKLKLGVNYSYEFLDRNLIFAGLDFLLGYGAISYKLKELFINLDLLSLLSNTGSSGQTNPLAAFSALPRPRQTDGPAFLEVSGYEYSISYGYKIDEKQIVRIIYKYRQEFHNLKSPKIEPEETINFNAIISGDLTPIVLSQLKPQGLLPNNSDFQREIGIEYMYKF